MTAEEQQFCPYKGLSPFEQKDSEYFFGRERDTRLIVANLFASPLTLLYGPSGVGKTSVLRAGVMHQLASNGHAFAVPPFANWHGDPLRELMTSIGRAVPGVPVEESRGSRRTLTGLVRSLCEGIGRRLMIILDQFEEYFLYNANNDEFADALGEAVSAADCDVGFLIALREDSLARLDSFEGRIPNLFETYFRVDHLDRAGAADAIKKPLARYNELVPGDPPWSVEPLLIETILDEIGGVYVSESARAADKVRQVGLGNAQIETAYLQLVVTKLWDEEVRQESRQLRSATYRRLGGAEQIVRSHVDEVLNRRLTTDEREMAFQIFNYLVTPTRTKIAHSATDLASYVGVRPDQMRTMLNKLVGGRDRILRTVANPNDPHEERFEVFHDRLAPAILEWRDRYSRDPIVTRSAEIRVPRASEVVNEGIALCLSGGGYRSMLFHVGVLWRLNECGYLPLLDHVSSVSTSSVTAAVLGHRWHRLEFSASGVATTFDRDIVEPLRTLAGSTIDVASLFTGLLVPGSGVSQRLAARFDKLLFAGASLQDLPDRPSFNINATNVQTGALWRFSKEGMGDYRVGMITNPRTKLAFAVAASSAIPPSLSPAVIELKQSDFTPGSGSDLQIPPFTDHVYLTDGSVYDNLAIETAWKRYKTILISDAGGRMSADPEPATDWARHALRTTELIDNSLRALRKRQIVSSFLSGDQKGALWRITSDLSNFPNVQGLPCAFDKTNILASIPTRLKELPANIQRRLINWGYAVSDVALRAHVDRSLPPPTGFPYPNGLDE